MQFAQRIGSQKDRGAAERWLMVLAINITLESSLAAILSFSGLNVTAAYWIVAGLCALSALRWRGASAAAPRDRWTWPAMAALLSPLILLSFRPVEEIDSINYLHYLIEWMANRATPYTFATNYVAFWELSFLPAWMVTRVDLFFPLLALKAVVVLAAGLWLLGLELRIDRRLLPWVVLSALLMQHYWSGASGVPTLKNDVLHGAGFVLLTLVVVRAAQRELAGADVALLSFGAAFAAVKYTGIFEAALAVAAVWLLRRSSIRAIQWLGVLAFFMLTSGHYYLANLIRFGSPFYPFQINLGPLHLPGTADLSNTSILYSLHDQRLWRLLFLPAGGVSAAGILFPEILAAILMLAAWRCALAAIHWLRGRTAPGPLDWTAACLLAGWLLYFRSVFSASASPGDLSFLINGLNSIRYVDGVLAASELFLVALAGRFAWMAMPLVAINGLSRGAMLYARIDTFPLFAVLAAAAAAAVLFVLLKDRAMAVAVPLLVLTGPLVVEHNRRQWTTYWNAIKPALEPVRGAGLAELGLEDGGYFAGHVVAAGNPVNTAVRCLLPEQIGAMAPAARPHYLVVLVTPGSEAARNWKTVYGPRIHGWGYAPVAETEFGGLFRLGAVPVGNEQGYAVLHHPHFGGEAAGKFAIHLNVHLPVTGAAELDVIGAQHGDPFHIFEPV